MADHRRTPGILSSMTEIGAPRPVTLPVTPATAAVCPYLMSADGRWRASTPAREHRCTVVTPPAVLAVDKQRRLCLAPEHVGCSTYLAALAATDQTVDGDARGSNQDPNRHVRPVARTAPLLLDHGRLAIGVPAISTERGAGQSGLVALMAVAFAAIVVARLSGGGPSLTPAQVGVDASPSPSIAASAPPTVAPAASDLPVASGPAPTLVPTEVEPTPVPAKPSVAPPSPSAAPTTYRVRSGDTLGAIAREFGTTAKVLMQLNGIDNPRLLHVGQVLQLP
jgi:LysM repeat protein